MSSPQDVLTILKKYIAKTENPLADFNKFLQYVERYVDRFSDEYKQLQDLQENPEKTITEHLAKLQNENKVGLYYRGNSILSVNYSQYYLDIVRKEYRKLASQSERPFPTEERIGVEIPGNQINPIDIQSDFIRWLEPDENAPVRLLRILFPENIPSIIVPSDILNEKFVTFCIAKIRQYLRAEKNSTYMHHKLITAFRHQEVQLKDLLNGVLTSPSRTLDSIVNPTEFTFHVWTQLSTNIINEFSKKSDKLIEEQNYCQAAYCLGYFCLYYKGQRQREKDIEVSLTELDRQMHKAPYAYTISQIYDFRDQKGVPLTKRCPKEKFNQYLEKRLKSKDDDSLPEILRIKTSDKREYYIFKQFYVPLTIQQIERVSTEFRDFYLNAWTEALKQNKKVKSMLDDKIFEEQVKTKLKNTEPLLFALLRYDYLLLTSMDAALSEQNRDKVQQYVDTKNKSLRPYHVILELERRKIHDDARLRLPFWQAIPILNLIVRFFQRFFFGPSKKRKDRDDEVLQTSTIQYGSAKATVTYSGAEGNDRAESEELGGGGIGPRTGKAQRAEYRRQVQELAKKFLEEDKSIEGSLEELAEKWNPLLDPVAKENLVEDVNSLIRDFLRRMKAGFRIKPPSPERLREMAEKLAYNQAFEKVRRKDYLQRYIELYMLKLLGS